MGKILRVQPDALREVSTVQAQLAANLVGIGVAQPLTDARDALTSLRTGSACEVVGTVLGGVAERLGAELVSHSGHLDSAAGRYEKTDAELGARLASTVP